MKKPSFIEAIHYYQYKMGPSIAVDYYLKTS